MKYENTRKKYKLLIDKGKDLVTVKTFNGETTRKYKRDVSWSHGFTHFVILETGETRWCGQQWFEENAK